MVWIASFKTKDEVPYFGKYENCKHIFGVFVKEINDE